MVWGMASMIYGYARVSTGDQTTDLQKDALVKAGCDRIFTYVIRHHDRIRAAWRMAWHILKTGGPSPRVIRSAPHQA